ncbi:MAG: hypothetical protein AAF141_01430 [Pseudomonadota bacterium]
MSEEEKRAWDLKLRRIDAEISHLNAMTAKLARESAYYPLVVGAAVATATIAVARFLIV